MSASAFIRQQLVLTIQQAAEMLAVSKSTLYRLINNGEIETIRIGSLQRIRPSALDRYLDRNERDGRERQAGFK